MKKHLIRILSVLLVLSLSVLIVLSITSGQRKQPIILTYAEVNPLDGTVPGAMAVAFKTKVEELSGGTVIIDLQAGGVLGTEDQILDNLLSGGNLTDITRISASSLTQYGCEKATLLSIPYTFVSEDHFWSFAESALAQDFLTEPYEKGLPLRGLCYGEEGFRHFFFKNEVKGLADLRNKKIRINADPIMTGMVSNLGASATTVPFTELYSALSTGVVDGAEQPIANYRSNAFPEVAPYLLLDGHTLGIMQIVISDYTWERLNEEQRGWIMEGARYASGVCREQVNEITANTLTQLEQEGVHVIPVEDKAPWVEVCQPTIQSSTAKLRDLYQQIVDLQ